MPTICNREKTTYAVLSSKETKVDPDYVKNRYVCPSEINDLFCRKEGLRETPWILRTPILINVEDPLYFCPQLSQPLVVRTVVF